MTEKRFNHLERETCDLCEKTIDTKKEFWTTVIDFKGSNIMVIKFYHSSCLKSILNGQMKVVAEKFKKQLFNVTRNLLGGITTNLKGREEVVDLESDY